MICWMQVCMINTTMSSDCCQVLPWGVTGSNHHELTTFLASKLQSVGMFHANREQAFILSAMYLYRVLHYNRSFHTQEYQNIIISSNHHSWFQKWWSCLTPLQTPVTSHFTSQELLDHSGWIRRPHKALAWVFSWLLKIETKIAKSI